MVQNTLSGQRSRYLNEANKILLTIPQMPYVGASIQSNIQPSPRRRRSLCHLPPRAETAQWWRRWQSSTESCAHYALDPQDDKKQYSFALSVTLVETCGNKSSAERNLINVVYQLVGWCPFWKSYPKQFGSLELGDGALLGKGFPQTYYFLGREENRSKKKQLRLISTWFP